MIKRSWNETNEEEDIIHKTPIIYEKEHISLVISPVRNMHSFSVSVLFCPFPPYTKKRTFYLCFMTVCVVFCHFSPKNEKNDTHKKKKKSKYVLRNTYPAWMLLLLRLDLLCEVVAIESFTFSVFLSSYLSRGRGYEVMSSSFVILLIEV